VKLAAAGPFAHPAKILAGSGFDALGGKEFGDQPDRGASLFKAHFDERPLPATSVDAKVAGEARGRGVDHAPRQRLDRRRPADLHSQTWKTRRDRPRRPMQWRRL